MRRTDDIRIFDSPEAFEQGSADAIAHSMQAAIRDRGVCTIVLSGGETPKGIYRRLAAGPLKNLIDWSRARIFFSDERCVPPDDPQSNFGMVRRELTTHVGIVPANVYRMETGAGPEKAALEYEEVLRTVLDPGPRRFDLVLLGIGSDGHTASLFPSTNAIDEDQRWVRAVYVPRLNSWRVTLTFPAINSGREVVVLASGESKALIVEQALNASAPTREIPITLVQPVQGSLRWMLDRQAAAGLIKVGFQKPPQRT